MHKRKSVGKRRVHQVSTMYKKDRAHFETKDLLIEMYGVHWFCHELIESKYFDRVFKTMQSILSFHEISSFHVTITFFFA